MYYCRVGRESIYCIVIFIFMRTCTRSSASTPSLRGLISIYSLYVVLTMVVIGNAHTPHKISFMYLVRLVIIYSYCFSPYKHQFILPLGYYLIQKKFKFLTNVDDLFLYISILILIACGCPNTLDWMCIAIEFNPPITRWDHKVAS